MEELVIKLPDGYVKTVMANQRTEGSAMDKLLRQAVIDGTPLPKEHGDLIDRNKIEYLKAINSAIHGHISWAEAIKRIKDSAPTIV